MAEPTCRLDRFAKQGEMKRHVTGLVPGRQHGGIFLPVLLPDIHSRVRFRLARGQDGGQVIHPAALVLNEEHPVCTPDVGTVDKYQTA
mgnify:CR=1 FL=1